MNLIHLNVIDSTSNYLKTTRLDDMTFVYADKQLKGKGRGDNTWISNPEENLTGSFIVRNPRIVKAYKFLSLYVGELVAMYLSKLGLRDVGIKWPNDIYVNGKKIAGILLEGQLPNYIIVGIGLNINQKDFGELSATSISNELHKDFKVKKIAKKLFNFINKKLRDFEYHPTLAVSLFNDFDILKNQQISFNYNKMHLVGVAKGINNIGELQVECNKKTLSLNSDEVNLIRKC